MNPEQMTPDLYVRKSNQLRQMIDDLSPYADVSLQTIEADHYKVERLFELLVVSASKLLLPFLEDAKMLPVSYEDSFKQAVAANLLPPELSQRLQEAARLRRVLIDAYDEIDYKVLRDSIEPAVQDFSQFVAIFARDL